jgi:DNA-binding MarR family transcriptional regulator
MDTQNKIDSIVENLFYAFPIIHKKLMKIDPPQVICDIRLSRLHIGILAVLTENTCPISEIADTFLIPKPQMTYLIDQMVKAGLVERSINAQDRRAKDIILTSKGKEIFRQCDEHIKNNVKEMLSSLTEKELSELAESLSKLREIGPRMGTAVNTRSRMDF